jgi:MFS family permease
LDTQNTPIHIKLWHRQFWLLALANLLLSASVYMMIPEMMRLLQLGYFSPLQKAIVMGSYGIGLFLFGPFVNYFVQRYRRRQVCLWSVATMILTNIALIFLLPRPYGLNVEVLTALRVIYGAMFGLAQMVFVSTLIVDAVESFQRTEANHHASWFSRFALSIGPLIAVVAGKYLNVGNVLWISIALSVVSMLLVNAVKFPFKAPEDDVKVWSLDRFFLPEGGWLFLNFFLITTIVGMVLTLPLSARFYSCIMLGFLIAIISEKYAFANADLKSETVTGLIAIIFALAIMLTRQHSIGFLIAATLIGFGVGIIGSRFLLFFIKLSRHCQRGTSQSSYFLAWESGIAFGLFIGLSVFHCASDKLLMCGIALAFVALLFYNFFVHSWYLKNRNR